MENVITFNKVLESVDELSLDEQEALVEILHRRVIEYRRVELAKEIQSAQQEFEEGRCRPATPSELMKKILS